MWFLGFSTAHTRSYLIIGAIVLVIILTIILRKLAVYLASQDDKSSDKEDDQRVDIQTNKNEDCIINCCPSAAIRTYALKELKEATNDFSVRIGIGGTSYVYLAELGDGKLGAVKRVMEERGGSQKMFLDEVSVLLRIRHPNLVGLMGFCLEKGEQLLLLEYVPNKSLFDRMHTFQGQSSGILSWSNRLSIALDIAYALDYLHSVADPAVIHRDIKSSNILLIDDNHAKLADFGLCKLGNDAQSAHTPTVVKGSLGYVDTQYLNTGIVSPKSDVYSFGVLILELITGLRSVQGSFTLPEWTEDCRKSDNVEILVGMLDPKLNGDVNLEQFRVLVDIANLALLANSEVRPDMSQIAYRIYSSMGSPEQELPV
ncbi:probable leucine-rich repeat receptor-like protein kinase At5g49770 [Olea europaea var. sylvestris]|uniref:probable leucine-rich repeat receptor-like protein kinase At5g49770 n=1 Tax=Olea europaea var. sylvestris TaxID=158386 RepID=UPI000C1D22F3|nr:probable leucine-rich repeat receptor-like protein kinase At5g49770 [Olea europaea var. sylvestris]XP_022874300.1 probable leucine-rich repeat receptor-like protein kinase At5g49770 [Olea europaea var. sylvestris]